MDLTRIISECQTIVELSTLLESSSFNEFERQFFLKRKCEIESRLQEWKRENQQFGLCANITNSWTPEQRQQLLSDWNNDRGLSHNELQIRKSVEHRQKIEELEALESGKLGLGPIKRFSAQKSFTLGCGSSGTFVYVGILQDGSEVAIKRMLIQACEDTAENERDILSLINTKKSPFIVSYRHFLMDNTFMYLILDLCEKTLDKYVCSLSTDHLQRHGRKMIKDIFAGLAFLHGEGILHRDLKPKNVLVDVGGCMKLADFGISRVLNEEETTFHTDAKGTTGWMPAEVIKHLNEQLKCPSKGWYKKKSDVQVAGMLSFFILSKGEHPFGTTGYEQMTNIVNGNPVNLRMLAERDARRFVSWLIQHNLDARPNADDALKHDFLDDEEFI
ncbi:probable serine/threonine-protein kinase ireA [Dendronephthya gigantea]|uniref:probable serine/threonine-protein kinase ireA n=1 Tax=Dendronephthya gigantea TaxID=151771 RepID=UPI00106AA385|nr:probable serine/threonine-protein kinase ireA [Dendronephthya gigantea]XP_028415833.1 probable serine/threonine-protein kinase ireA [Dendronephthya gigantea]XP_028415834.1 probable serine/threonine-protein kinase ireA [Dendronephthya gigantea]